MKPRVNTWYAGALIAGLLHGCSSEGDPRPAGSGGSGRSGSSGAAGATGGAGPGGTSPGGTGPGGAGPGGAGPGGTNPGGAGPGGTGTGGTGPGGAGSGGAGGSAQGGAAGSGAGAGGSAGSSGGSAGVGGAPPDPTAACAITPERVRITEVAVGSTVVNDENEAALRPIVIAAVPQGGSRLAWMGSDGNVHVAALDGADRLVGAPLVIPANDFSDLYADDAGGVLLLSRDAQGAGERHCGTLTNLCGNVSRQPASAECWDMYLVRFDGGNVTWSTKLTESTPERPPYLTGPTDGSRLVYIWQPYAHHGRIAFDGTNYASYFGAAIAVSERCVDADSTLATGVNIHQGDRMNVVGPGGALLTGNGSFGWGCSHSGYERILWDPGASRFVTVCKTDNNNRISLAPRYSTIRPVDLAASNLGDLVLATGGGYWLSASDAEPAGGNRADVFLLRFSVSGNTATLNDTLTVAGQSGLNERAPHLAAYGTDGLVVAWETSNNTGDLRRNDTSRALHVQVRNRATGAAIGAPHTVSGVLGNRYHALRAFPDGSVAFPAPGANNQSIKILRILPCTS